MSDFDQHLYDEYVSKFKRDSLYGPWRLWQLWRWYDDKYRPLLKGLTPQARILEVGCGAGYMLGYLKHLGFTTVLGIDISAEQVALSQAAGHAALQVDALAYLAQQDQVFDAILMLDVVEHFPRDELYELLRLTQHALKPNGLVILQTPNGEGLLPNYVIYGDLTHHTILSSSSLRQLLQSTGFVDIRFKEAGPARWLHLPLFLAWQVVRGVATLVKLIEIGRWQRYWTENLIAYARKPA